jgi:sugar lactone lactonase YvrE
MTRSIPLFLVAVAAALAATVLTGAASATPEKVFPTRIALPNGFGPEGIAIGKGPRFYVGSIATGAIYRGSLLTGRGAVLVPAKPGRQAIGLALDRNGRLFVAGGPTGKAWVYDARTGGDLREYVLTTESPTFVNDVVVTRDGAYFTDSNRQVLYRVPVGPNGQLGTAVQELPLTGDIEFVPGEFNANGIDATPNGKTLVIVQSNAGKLFTVDPASGVTDEIELGGASVSAGDGILLAGRTLYVVRNQLNRIAVVRLAENLSSGSVVQEVTNPDFAVPTTVDDFGSRLYVVNARFGTPATPDTEYWVTGLRRPR